ncbi:MAG: DNA repair protein RadA [Rickettsiales bacterium]|nr:DNA repair protein RadA [Rickettsiales bacterium]
MGKKYQYICQKCGAAHSKWSGQCSDCGAWNSIEMESAEGGSFYIDNSGQSQKIESLAGEITVQSRMTSDIAEFDRVLGGGIVYGSAVLIGGDPGIGKSTLLLQLISKMTAEKRAQCLYVSGEESVNQMRLHAKRLTLSEVPVQVLSHTNINDIITTIKSISNLELVIIDSIQTMFLPTIPSAPGTVSQVRSSAYELITMAKQRNVAVLIVGHVTKDGQIAGPKVLEHMVDGVLYFEGEKNSNYRILRSVKNRFGNVNEIGVFEMSESGLVEIANPSLFFLSERQKNVSGSAIFAGIEGSRPILVEIQSLVAPSNMVSPRRAVVGWDLNRLSMMIAVLSTKYGLHLANYEVYLNVVGGLKIIDTAADLAVISSLISALKNKPLDSNTIFIGEVGLSGEIRKVSNIEARLKESAKLGFKKAVIPPGVKLTKSNFGIQIEQINHIREIENFFAGGSV